MSPTQTPYSPPLAPVRDPAEPELPKPPAIARAAICLWISAAIVVLVTAFALAGSDLRQALPAILISLFTFGLLVLVALKINAGRGWVRWLFLVLWLLGSAMFVVGLVMAPQAFLALPKLDQAVALVQFTLQTAALVFMFLPASGNWLRSRRS